MTSLYVITVVLRYCLFRLESSGKLSNSLKLFFAKYTVNRAVQVIVIFIADVINIDKIISKRIPYLVCRNLENWLYTCEMGFFAQASMKDKCRNRLNASYLMRLALNDVKPATISKFRCSKKMFLCHDIFVLFMFTFSQFSWVAAIFTGEVFERFWVTPEKG